MTKRDLRLDYKRRRSNISSQFLSNASSSIAKNALQIPIWNYNYYHLFMPIVENKEPDTSFLLSILQHKHKNIVLPKVSGSHLKHYLLKQDTRLHKSEWNILEPVGGLEVSPKEIDVVFVPLLAFDKNGNRVGYGKGFYDGFLVECRPQTIKVGLSLFGPTADAIDVFEKDISLDYCVTPDKNYSFIPN